MAPYNLPQWTNVSIAITTQGNFRVPLYKGNISVNKAMEPWKSILDKQEAEIIGESKEDLPSAHCSSRECKLGNFIADAAVDAFSGIGPTNSLTPNVAIINSGSIRTSLQRGNVTYGQLVMMYPYDNTLVAFNLPGSALIEALDLSLTKGRIFQVSGLKVTFDLNAPIGQRIQNLFQRCQNCGVPKYDEYSPKKLYRVITTDFFADGNGGYSMFPQYATDIQKGTTLKEAIFKYLRETQPISPKLEHRILYTKHKGRILEQVVPNPSMQSGL